MVQFWVIKMNGFAIVQAGGKQLRVEPNQVIGVERLKVGDHQKEVLLDKVLVVRRGESFDVGNPYVKGALVVCEYLAEPKDAKKISFKIRRRKNSRRKKGHRQILSKLRVKEIRVPGD